MSPEGDVNRTSPTTSTNTILKGPVLRTHSKKPKLLIASLVSMSVLKETS